MVCLATLGLSTEKIGTAPDLPDRPNRLSETKVSHILIFHSERGLARGLADCNLITERNEATVQWCFTGL